MPPPYNPVGLCIYCGATTYIPGSTQTLRKEHVIAETISGELVLPEASCQRCERKINPWETRLFRGALLGCKTFLGLDTKRPKERPKALPLFDSREEKRVNGRERKVMVPIEDYPISLLLLKYRKPRIFEPIPYDKASDSAWIRYFTDVNLELLKDKYDLPEFGMSSLDTFALCRTLAKTAHAYAVAEHTLNGFIPLLPHFIMGEYDTERLYYVGGSLELETPGSDLHEINIEPPTFEQWQYIVVRIRLFSKFGAPTYRVVAGKRLNPVKPPEVTLAEAMRQRPKVNFFGATHPIPEGLWNHDTSVLHSKGSRAESNHVRLKITYP